MKVSTAVILGAVVEASHFRAISYNVIQGGSNKVQVSRTQAWRRKDSGYSGGCTAAHVASQTPSVSRGSEYCMLLSGVNCGSVSSAYTVTDVEDSLVDANNYCYGYQQDEFTKPAGPYTMKWSECCWVPLTTDTGVPRLAGSISFTATINDVDNNTPQVKIPPIWKILAGCPAQTLDLNPIDLDNDQVRCRFATSSEAEGAYHGNDFNSITLNANTCILTYDGTQDQAIDGVKAIAVQVEDFDSNGVVRSSMPVQFLAMVWQPSNSNFNNRQLSMHGAGNIVQMPAFFEMDDSDDTDHIGRRRRQAGLPSYCAAAPILVSPSPSAGDVIPVPVTGTTVNMKARSQNGAITRFQYNSPIGMQCTPVNANGEAACTFVPSAAQQGQALNFCFIADDAAGLSTERRCVTLTTGVTIVNQNKAEVTEIFSLIKHVIPSMEGDFEDYGCAGVGNMDTTLKTRGHPVDAVDKALNIRKHCINCARDEFGAYTLYDFDEDNNNCDNKIGTAGRTFCECDAQFVNTVDGLQPTNTNFDTNQCVLFAGHSNGACCKNRSGLFTWYNTQLSECCSGSVVSNGSC